MFFVKNLVVNEVTRCEIWKRIRN